MLAAAMFAIEMHVATVEVMSAVVDADIFSDHRGRSPISRDPNPVGRVVAVNPGVAGSGARGARDHDWAGSAESDSDADLRRGEEAASQKHHYCDRLFHFLALLARMKCKTLASMQVIENVDERRGARPASGGFPPFDRWCSANAGVRRGKPPANPASGVMIIPVADLINSAEGA
jgi:hypothetical protein